MKNNSILFVLLLLFPMWISAQPYSVKPLGAREGLSNNNVLSIAQDKQGFLWFATEEGLNKFDGTQFINFYKGAPLKLNITGNELNCLLDDPTDSVLWIGTQRAGLNAYDYVNDTFKVYAHNPDDPNSLITNDVTGIHPAADGNLWITTYWNGIDYLDKKTGRFTHYNRQTIPQLASNHVWTVVDGGDGKLYIGHVYDGLSILSLKDKTVKNFTHNPADPNSLPGDGVMCIYKDNSGNIWLGTSGGLALYNSEDENFVRFKDRGVPFKHRVFDIRQMADNKLWVATEFGGIAILDLAQRLFVASDEVHFRHIEEGGDEYGLSSPSVRCLFQDSYHNIWVGTWGGGINFLSHEPSLFNVYSYSPIPTAQRNLTGKIVSSVSIDHAGRLWIGTDKGDIDVFEEGHKIAAYGRSDGDLNGNPIQTSLCDSKGNLWFGLFTGGVCRYEFGKRQFKQIFPKEKADIDVRTLYEDENQVIWIGTSAGMYKADLTGAVEGPYVERNQVRSIFKDGQGRFWVGTFGDGIIVYSPGFEELKHFYVADGFPSNTINATCEDSRGRLWIATGEGLVCFPSVQKWDYTVYGRESGLENTHIRAISEDASGNIWFSTNKGISCYVEAKDCFYNYGAGDNVPIDGFMGGSVARNAEGRLFFGSLDGLCHFNPQRVLAKRQAPPVVMTEMRIFEPLQDAESDEVVLPLNNRTMVKLDYMQNSFSIAFNIQNYALTSQVEYAYMLKGLEDAWYTVKDPDEIIFRNVPPGDYRFLVKTRIRNQEWADTVTTLHIRIHPPLWLTWWAKVLYILLGASIVFAIFYAYKRKVDMEVLYDLEKKNREQEQRLNRERLRFYTNITHELRTPLTLILGPLEDMQKSNSLSGKDAQKISVIHQSAIRLLNLINQILEFRKTETQNKKLCVALDNISTLVQETGLKYKELNRNPEIELRIRPESDNMPLYFDREVMTIILDNLISNAIKYTERGVITLSLRRVVRNDVNYTEVEVSDTGYGITPQALPHIFDRYYQEGAAHQASGTGIGLALVKNLVALHEADISVDSTPGKGSVFCVSLLTDNTYPDALHAEAPAKAADESEDRDELPEAATPAKRILLVVEDNEDIRRYIAESFSDLFDVKTAVNGRQGMEQALRYTPDIIVSDIMMPIMSGTDLCRQLKEDVRTSHIPIILLTAKDSLQDKEEGYRVGADSYLTKPFSASLLHSRINNLLDSRRRMAESFNATAPRQNLEEKRAILAESLSKLDNEFMEKMNRLIEERLESEKIDIGYLAENMCMSKSTLYRKMKALTGLSTNEYVRKVKMQYAERLLLEGRYNVSEIAFRVGINSVVYFRQCFKEEFGVLPSEYLKQE